jgi:hypothetical protein
MTPDPNVSAADLQKQCGRICEASFFSGADQLKKILNLLVSRYLEAQPCHQDDIGEVLFGPSTDSSQYENRGLLARQDAGRVRKKLEQYYENAQDFLVIELPTGKAGHGYKLKVYRRSTTTEQHLQKVWRDTYRAQLKEHWKLQAMGSGGLYQGGQWYFSGRTEALRHIVQWLSEPASGGMARVLTGDPRAGKSAVLGYLVTSSDTDQILDPNLAAFLKTMPAGTVPEPGCVDFAISLRDRTLDATLKVLADYLRSDPDDVVNVLASRQEKTGAPF